MNPIGGFKKIAIKLVQLINRNKSSGNSEYNTNKSLIVKCIDKNGKVSLVCSSSLKKGDIIEISEGEIIPCHGEIVEGVATVDESVITGESALVVREAGGETSFVTAGTKVVCSTIKVRALHTNKYVNKKEVIEDNKRVNSINFINFEV